MQRLRDRLQLLLTASVSIAAAVLFMVAAPGEASGVTTSPSTPVVRLVDQEYFGSFFRGETFRRKVKISNGGTAALTIQKVNSKCACAHSVGFDASIAPGAEGTFELEIDTGKVAVGKWGKRISVFTNDPQTPIAVFHFNIEVKELAKVPEKPLVIAGLFTKVKRLEFPILPATQTRFRVVHAVTQNPHFTANVDLGDSGYKLILEAPVATAPAQHKGGFVEVLFETVDGRQVLSKWPVVVKHQHFVVFSPDNLVRFSPRSTSMLLRRPDKPLKRRLRLVSLDPSQSFTIEKVEVRGAEGVFQASATPVKEGAEYKVELSLPKYQKETFVKGMLVVTTSIKEFPEVQLEVQAIFGRR